MPSVLITEENPALATLTRSWAMARYSDVDGTGPMASLHEFGNSLVAVARLDAEGTTLLGSGVMVGPGLLLTATHVLDEFSDGKSPVFLTMLPEAARAWLPRSVSVLSGPSAFSDDHTQVSDVTLVSCTLNSQAHADHPLMLAPMRIVLPLLGERLWAFGYRQGAIDDGVALVMPIVASGLVTAVFPDGRGERMPATCLEVEMDVKGGMSGGPVVNGDGDVIGIVTSSFDGGPSFITLIWDALRLSVQSTVPSPDNRAHLNLLGAQFWGLVKLKATATRRRRGDILLELSDEQIALLFSSMDPAKQAQARAAAEFRLPEERREAFEEVWLGDMEDTAAEAARIFLEGLDLSSARQLLAMSEIPEACLASIRHVRVEDFEGVEDPEVLDAHDADGMIELSFAFELLGVIWTVEVGHNDYLHNADAFQQHFMNIEIGGANVRMGAVQRCYFEADITLDPLGGEFTEVSIARTGIVRRSKRLRDAPRG